MEGFNYVVNPPTSIKVVFGSSLPRQALPLKGRCLSPFMRAHQGDSDRSPGPVAYVEERDYMSLKWPSNLGYTAFASVLPRLIAERESDVPPLGIYSLEPKLCIRKKSKVYIPFGSNAPRLLKSTSITPPPDTYTPKPRRQLDIFSAFMTFRKITPSVLVFCSPKNLARCVNCGETPHGDYWYNAKDEVDMCAECMRKLKKKLHSCGISEKDRLHIRLEVQEYQKALYCDFFHDHKGVGITTQIITPRQLQNKIRLENYLYPYFPN